MNIQAQLLELAEKHESNPGVSALVKTIQENLATVLVRLSAVRSSCDYYEKGARLTKFYGIPRDGVNLVQNAALVSSSMSVIFSACLDLATVLEALGEDVSFC